MISAALLFSEKSSTEYKLVPYFLLTAEPNFSSNFPSLKTVQELEFPFKIL